MKKKQKKYLIYTLMHGYKVLKTDCKSDKGVEELKKVLKGNSSAFAGQSGVRKINTYK